jgi:hypothetical protein
MSGLGSIASRKTMSRTRGTSATGKSIPQLAMQSSNTKMKLPELPESPGQNGGMGDFITDDFL